MRILHAKINGYKKLKNFEIVIPEGEERLDNLNLKFLIGENGSGKSSFLEAISIIFSKTLINQDVGFEFELEYVIKESQEESTFVRLTNHNVKNNNQNKNYFEYFIKAPGNNEYEKCNDEVFSERKDLHPGRIMTIGSGPNNNFEELIINRPIQTLKEKLIDTTKISSTDKNLLEDMLFNPVFLNFDSESLIFILISIFNFPSEKKDSFSDEVSEENIEGEENAQHTIKDERQQTRENSFNENMKSLLGNTNFIDNEGFSLRIKKSELDVMKKEILNSIDASDYLKKFISNIEELLLYANSNMEIDNNRTIYFFNADDLKKNFDNMLKNEVIALDVLTTLMIAHRIGIIEEATIFLKHENEKMLVTQSSLSDGEWFWLTKIGLIVLLQTSIEDEFLIIYDELDAFLNEGWIEDFILFFNTFSKIRESNGHKDELLKKHDYFIATHSTLMLTDALPNQVYKFEKVYGNVVCSMLDFSTFGADRGIISSKLFLNEKMTGRYVETMINEAFQSEDDKIINQLLDALGSGYNRFLIQELRIKLLNENKKIGE